MTDSNRLNYFDGSYKYLCRGDDLLQVDSVKCDCDVGPQR